MMGGNIIIPIDISTDETIMSIIKNGTKIKKAIWKAIRNSDMTKPGNNI